MRRGPSDLRVMSPLSALRPTAIPTLNPCYARISMPQALAWARTSTRSTAAAVLPQCHETEEQSHVRSILELRTKQGTTTTTTKHSAASPPPSTPPSLSDMRSNSFSETFRPATSNIWIEDQRYNRLHGGQIRGKRGSHDNEARALSHHHGGSRNTVG